jgi:hypothetical protein
MLKKMRVVMIVWGGVGSVRKSVGCYSWGKGRRRWFLCVKYVSLYCQFAIKWHVLKSPMYQPSSNTLKCSLLLENPVKDKGKGKVHPITGHEGPEVESRYCSTLSLTSTLDGVSGQRHAPAALHPGKTRYPLHRRLGRSQVPSLFLKVVE